MRFVGAVVTATMLVLVGIAVSAATPLSAELALYAYDGVSFDYDGSVDTELPVAERAAELVNAGFVASAGVSAPGGQLSDSVASRGIPSAFDEAAAFADELRTLPNPSTAATIAVDRTTGQVYRGTSGELTVWLGQLEDLLPNPLLEPWRAANCGEVSACASALANGANLADLDIVTVRVRTGDIFPPCDNCASWVPGGGS